MPFDPLSPLDWLGAVGNVVDTPWAMGRAALAGNNPLEGVFDPEKRTSGRDMLEAWGAVDPNQEGLDAGDVAGFAVDMVDPISLALGTWSGKALKALGAAKAARKSQETANLIRMGMNVMPEAENLAARAINPAMQAAEAGGALVPAVKPLAQSIDPLYDMTKGLMPQVAPAKPLALPAPTAPLYSRLEVAANNLPNKIKAESLRNLLAKAPEGVSKEEMDWVLKGLPEKGVLNKEQVLKHVKENGIRTEIKTFGREPNPGMFEVYDDYDNSFVKNFPSEEEAIRYIKGQGDDGGSLLLRPAVDDSQWKQHSVPGGDNYKEMLIKLPEHPELTAAKSGERLARQIVNESNYNPWGNTPMFGGVGQGASEAEKKAFNEASRKLFLAEQKHPNYKSAHWSDDNNVLAHARFDDRVINGEKTLFVHEIQSDWHQAGAKRGYGKPVLPPLKQSSSKTWVIGDGLEQHRIEELINGKYQVRSPGATYQTYNSLKEAEEAASRSLINHLPEPVANAPFKGDEWAKLTVKHLLDYATKNGYERIAFANGNLASKFSAGGATGDTAAALAKWYNETIPNIAKKIIGGNKEMVAIADRNAVTIHHPLATVEPHNYNVSSFKIPQATKKRISRYGQTLLSAIPIGAGAGIAYNDASQ